MLSSRGEKILMVDADGATKFSDLDKVEKALDELQGGKEDMAVSVGSRAHLQDDAVAQVRIPFILIFIATEAHTFPAPLYIRLSIQLHIRLNTSTPHSFLYNFLK